MHTDRVDSPGERARRAVKRAVVYARISATGLIVLGALSALVSMRNPISASFAISLAVVVNGIIEMRLSNRLARQDSAAPRRLALNQIALGFEIAAYSAWQVYVFTPESLHAVLARPLVADFLDLIEPEVLQMLLALLPPMVRVLYLVVALVAVVSCGAVAWFYRAREKHLRALREGEHPGACPPPLQ